ncbi:unnamed protein product [Brassica rapa]|uniref:Helicase ATP-binding domain-containing protein n=1 Tax=Brassica campestris TaxID=3711 RepID=A0A3P6AQV4_BRACM|nr:unnamed protein product [Brassica rapa]VDC89694.1 unnamed protein product [Brassica rapa]
MNWCYHTQFSFLKLPHFFTPRPALNLCVELGEVEYLVLDEADQMLAVGFEEAVESILENLPHKRQSMLFSATMPTWVKKLARKYLDNPLNIDPMPKSIYWIGRLDNKMRISRKGSNSMQSQPHPHQNALF